MAQLENARLMVLRAVARQLSFRKAAEELYLTQPAVSLQIKALEEDLGVQLFDRTGSRVALTAAGRVMLNHAEQVHAMLQQAEHEIAAMSGELAGQLGLGASTTIAQYVLPSLLGKFLGAHPRVKPTLISGNTEHIVNAAVQHEIALGFIEGPSRSKDVREEAFLVDELVMIVPAAHEWAERGSVSVQELKSVPLLMRERGSGTLHVVEMALERHFVKPASLEIAMELDSTEAIKSAVEAGLGAGFVSKWALAKDARTGTSFRIVDIEGLRIKRDFLMIYAQGIEPQGLVQEFRRYLLDRTAGFPDMKKVHRPRA
ncbi:LysR substrate-binding domain-containing protein [Telmatobacter sp. DSM 110680]|uniref:LysR substrate-binding domain-containing protein n=1 Tax=Telmatobacter sp. DSM 110680 TaxID=3036704 RepID=A0AAU7DNG9_9BACT